MKSLEELKEIRERTLKNLMLRTDVHESRVVVGMGTCGIAAGARSILLGFVDEIAQRNVAHVTVSQTGCVGMCRYEPIVDILMPGEGKVTYVNVTPDMIGRIVTEHLVGGAPVIEYTIGAKEKA